MDRACMSEKDDGVFVGVLMADLKKKKKKKRFLRTEVCERERDKRNGNEDGLRRKRNQELSILSLFFFFFLLCFFFFVFGKQKMFGDFVKKRVINSIMKKGFTFMIRPCQ
ncbi:hypothetical protein YC2023_112953 [Brassica napus]|uniref:(rape) hypothetical protein n=1 Tax=Brassica napus TaxID=3708 RepID=A0A816IMX4_BRANA|nr:unnamed protein product [Brassica napus]